MIETTNYFDVGRIRTIAEQHRVVIENVISHNLDEIKTLCETALEKLNNGGRLFFIGNGGSAADSQHLAAEFVGRFKNKRRPLPALALTTDSSVLTAIANDFGYDAVFERQVETLCQAGDMLIGISTSGNSENIIRAMKEAKRKNVCTVGLLGRDGGELASIVEIPIVILSEETARIQEAHILIGHILCELCDEYFVKHY